MFNLSSLAWEVLRKMIHLSGLVIVLIYTLSWHFFSERIAILVLTGLLLLLLEFEHVRLEHRPKIMTFFKSLFREHEENGLAASVFYVISCIICFAAFDYWIALIAMFMTIFGDIAAALMGKAFGQTRIYKNKTIVGTLSGFAANAIAGILILRSFPWLILSMAVVATFVEAITNRLDDNLTVPLFTGFLGQMAIYYFDLQLPNVDFTFLSNWV